MSRIIANNIRHNDAASDSLSFDSSARVGIGTASPTEKLHVSGSGGTTILVSDSSDYAGLSLSGSGSSNFIVSDDRLDFLVNGSTRASILTTGGLTFNGDTAAANALDDYEEGTWTVQVNGTTVSSNVVARYTKIGNKVTCECRFDAATFPTFSGDLYINLPFAMASGLSMYPHGPLCYFYPNANWDTFSNFVGFRPWVAPGSSVVKFSLKLTDSDWQSNLTSTNTNVSGQGTLYLEFQLTYWTSWT